MSDSLLVEAGQGPAIATCRAPGIGRFTAHYLFADFEDLNRRFLRPGDSPDGDELFAQLGVNGGAEEEGVAGHDHGLRVRANITKADIEDLELVPTHAPDFPLDWTCRRVFDMSREVEPVASDPQHIGV